MYEIFANEKNYTRAENRKIEYIVIHYTANNGDTARNNGDYFKNNNVNASAHYFVDEKEVVRSVREKDIAWHVGAESYNHKYCRNRNSIGIEMCSRIDKNGKYYIKAETVHKTAMLVVDIMKKYGISSEKILRHYDVTGKKCPRPFVENENLWKDFLNMINLFNAVGDTAIEINGEKKTIKSVNINGFNFVKLRDLESKNIEVGYNENEKLPYIKTI